LRCKDNNFDYVAYADSLDEGFARLVHYLPEKYRGFNDVGLLTMSCEEIASLRREVAREIKAHRDKSKKLTDESKAHKRSIAAVKELASALKIIHTWATCGDLTSCHVINLIDKTLDKLNAKPSV